MSREPRPPSLLRDAAVVVSGIAAALAWTLVIGVPSDPDDALAALLCVAVAAMLPVAVVLHRGRRGGPAPPPRPPEDR